MGIRKKILFQPKTYIDLLRFSVRKKIWGFHNAILMFKTLHKESIIPVLKANGAIIGSKCDIETGLTFHNCKSFKNLVIGNNSHIGKDCFFDLRDNIIIGDNVVISMQCSFITHIDLSFSPLSKKFPATSAPIVINNNCYVGVRTTILMGVNIYLNAFIAAGSLVNKNVEESSLVGGVPAKLIKKLN